MASSPQAFVAPPLNVASVCAPGMDNVTCASKMGCAKSQVWLPSDVAVWARRTRGNTVAALTIVLTMPREAHTVYGAPAGAGGLCRTHNSLWLRRQKIDPEP